MQVSIKVIGFVQALSVVRVLGEGAAAVNGPIATFGSTLSLEDMS